MGEVRRGAVAGAVVLAGPSLRLVAGTPKPRGAPGGVTIVRRPTSDPEGLAPFYLVAGGVLGGIGVSAALGATAGTGLSRQRLGARASVLVLASVVSGVGGALSSDPLGLGLLPAATTVLVGLGVLVSAA